ncbi:uncharacterized protein PRCAT00002343001 [Priceomyces carsonii]|uniref:uncharacterized protein n=1 Tax=Priceomyces carsonii TaxID=28549 RepID=UPI002ED8FA20|nr:unnamed protein product [Priceomyces carsonii]
MMSSHLQNNGSNNPFDDSNIIFNQQEEQQQLLNNGLDSTHTRSNVSLHKPISNKKFEALAYEDLGNLKSGDSFHEHKISTDEDGDDPVRFDSPSTLETSFAHNMGPYTDSYGNNYDHVDFDSKKYTSKLKFKGNRLVYFTSAFVSLFVSLFGYEQGVCSGVLTFETFIKFFNHPSSTEIGLVISILEIGAMISSLFVSKISDRFGRKITILLGTFVFMIGGTLQSFAINLYVFAVGRVLSGFGVGILSTIVPSYQCEISPSEERGKLVCAEFTGNISGYALSVWVDYFCYFIQNVHGARKNPHSFAANLSWRLPLFIQVIIAFVLFLGGFFIVESPRWLLDEDLDQQGFNVLALLYDSHLDDEKPREEFFMIKNSILSERIATPKYERTWKNMFKNYLTRVLIACSALAFAQFNGINIISYYAPMVFEEAGFNDSNALLMTGINAIVYLLSTIPPWFLVDRWGRKPILISGGLSMAICLLLISWVMFLNKGFTPSLVALLVVIYNASFGYSWGPIGFLIPPEVYPLAVRSKGVSLSTATNWLANYIVGQVTPIAQELIKWAMYIFPASSCIISVFVVYFFYPETKGVELEDMDKVFNLFYNKGAPKMNEYSVVDTDMPADIDDYELDQLEYSDNEISPDSHPGHPNHT